MSEATSTIYRIYLEIDLVHRYDDDVDMMIQKPTSLSEVLKDFLRNILRQFCTYSNFTNPLSVTVCLSACHRHLKSILSQ